MKPIQPMVFVNLGIIFLLCLQAYQVKEVRMQITHLRDLIDTLPRLASLQPAPPELPSSEPDPNDPSAQADLKRLVHLHHAMSNVNRDNPTDYAQAIAEADLWIIDPDDEENVLAELRNHVAQLRDLLESRISKELDSALSAYTGATATYSLSEASELFGLLPQPETDEEKSQMNILSAKLANTARRVDEIRRLRYNEWVSKQIGYAFSDFHTYYKYFGEDDENLIRVFINHLGKVDTSYLEPAVSGIYHNILTLTSEALSEPNKVELAKKLSSPSIARKTPLDF